MVLVPLAALPGLPVAFPASVPMHWEARTVLDKHEDARDQLLDAPGSPPVGVWPAYSAFSVLDELATP